MRELRFSLRIHADDYLAYYRGSARSVIVTADNGLRVQFPASVLQRFVTPEGISGRFAIRFDDQNRFVDIRRL